MVLPFGRCAASCLRDPWLIFFLSAAGCDLVVVHSAAIYLDGRRAEAVSVLEGILQVHAAGAAPRARHLAGCNTWIILHGS